MSKGNKSDRNKPETLEMDGVSLDRQKRLDSSWYEKKYPDRKYLWIRDMDGDVDKYLRGGAQIQGVEHTGSYEGETHGYKSKQQEGYVSVIGGADNGVPFEQILMYMPREMYAQRVLDPKQRRNEDIRTAMGMNNVDSDARKGNEDIETYVPNNPAGGTGFEQIGGKVGFNQLTQS